MSATEKPGDTHEKEPLISLIKTSYRSEKSVVITKSEIIQIRLLKAKRFAGVGLVALKIKHNKGIDHEDFL